MALSFIFHSVIQCIYLWYNRAKYVLSRPIGLFTEQKVEKRQFVDVKVQIDIPIGRHGFVRLLGNTGDLLLSKSSNIKKSRVEQS